MARPIALPSPPAAPSSEPLADVSALLEASTPRPTVRALWPAFGAVWLVLFIATAASDDPVRRAGVQMLTWVVTLAMVIVAWTIARSYQEEIKTLARVDDFLFVGREREAALALHLLMTRPMRTGDNRVRALSQLATALNRLGRTDDALIVYDAVLAAPQLEGTAGTAVKLERTLAVLKADHLYDADRGIIDLRRLLKKWTERRPDFLPLSAGVSPGDQLLAGLKLLELYRDVKTGHAEEAVALFESDLPLLRAALGHRVAEAYGLVAVALDQLGRPEDATAHFAAATTLRPISELTAAYAELIPLSAKYPAAPVPPL